MQRMRSHGWERFLANVTLFCKKHGIEYKMFLVEISKFIELLFLCGPKYKVFRVNILHW
jgi:hypothetical protein